MGLAASARVTSAVGVSCVLLSCSLGSSTGNDDAAAIAPLIVPSSSSRVLPPTDAMPRVVRRIKPAPPKIPRTCPDRLRAGLDRADAIGNPGLGVAIADPTSNLRRFFDAWIDVALQRRGRRKLRVAVYGDSNVARDWAAGFLRKFWGEQLGFGGHGYVAAGPPDQWYQHRGIRTKRGDGWRTYAVTVPPSPTGVYGHGALLSQGMRKGAYAVWHSANGIESPAKPNEQFTDVAIHYLCEPDGGTFKLFVDGVAKREVATTCAKTAFRRQRLRMPLGNHEVKLVTEKPGVTVLGAVFENDKPGIVVDNMGVNSANLFHLLKMGEPSFSAGMKARGYDLVILAGGTSMTPGYAHRRWGKQFIERLRGALGNDVSVVVLSRAPYGKKVDGKVVPRPQIAKLQRDDQIIARDNRVAFWDYWAAMGGDAALPNLVARKLLYEDMLHVTPYLHKVMMRRFAAVMRKAFYDHLARAGWPCRRRHKTAHKH